MSTVRTWLGGLLAVVLVVAGAACGSDDGAASDVPGGTEPSPTSDDGGAGDDGADDGGGTTTDGDASGLLPDQCEFLASGATYNPLGSITSPNSIDLEEQRNYFAEIAESAPEEIKDEVAVLANAFNELTERLEGVDLSSPQAFQDPQVIGALTQLESVFGDEFAAAGEAVSQWVDEHCVPADQGG